MAYDSNVYRLLTEVIENFQSNQFACTKINLSSKQLDKATVEEKLAFCKGLAENKYVIYLDISRNALDAEFTPFFISALEQNQSITTLYYDKQFLKQESIIAIQKIIERNRQSSLEREINPKLIPLEELEEWEKTFDAADRAAESGDLDLLFTLLTHNPTWISRLESPTLGFVSLLHTAAEHGQIDCAKLLIKLGADVNLNPVGTLKVAKGTPLHNAIESNFFVIVQLLLEAQASVLEKENGFPPLHWAKDVEIAELLIKFGADIHAVCAPETSNDIDRGNSVLHSVVAGPLELLEFLIKKGANARAVNTQGDTVLHKHIWNSYQTKEEFIARLNLLIQAGADPTILNNEKRSPLALAKYINSPFTSLIEEATNDYAETRKNTQLISLGRRKSAGNLSLFKTLPDELCMHIANLASDSSILDKESVKKVVEDSFLPDVNDDVNELDDSFNRNSL